MPTTKDTNTRTISPRVDGKRPRIKPRALDVDEHVRLVDGSATTTPVGADKSVARTTAASPLSKKEA